MFFFFFFQAEDGIRDPLVTGVQTCALPICRDGGADLYHARTVPAGSYGLAAPVPSIGIPNILVVRADLPASAAHELTALIFQAKPALVAAHPDAHGLDRRSALATYPVPLHPGAGQYYRDTKVM